MALPCPGSGTVPISLADVQNEFGGSNPISMDEYYRGGANVVNSSSTTTIPTSGAISLSQFFCTEDYIPYTTWISFCGQETFASGQGYSARPQSISYNWTVPSGVSRISAVCIASGGCGQHNTTGGNAYGGTGGAVSWAVDFPVTAGETLELIVPPQHSGWSNASQPAAIKRGSTYLLNADGYGTSSGSERQGGGNGGYCTGIFTGIGTNYGSGGRRSLGANAGQWYANSEHSGGAACMGCGTAFGNCEVGQGPWGDPPAPLNHPLIDFGGAESASPTTGRDTIVPVGGYTPNVSFWLPAAQNTNTGLYNHPTNGVYYAAQVDGGLTPEQSVKFQYIGYAFSWPYPATGSGVFGVYSYNRGVGYIGFGGGGGAGLCTGFSCRFLFLTRAYGQSGIVRIAY